MYILTGSVICRRYRGFVFVFVFLLYCACGWFRGLCDADLLRLRLRLRLRLGKDTLTFFWFGLFSAVFRPQDVKKFLSTRALEASTLCIVGSPSASTVSGM